MEFEGCKTGDSWSAHRKHKEPPCIKCHEGRKQYYRNWKQKNKDKIAKERRDNYLRKQKERLAYGKKYRQENPEYVRANARKRRALKLNVISEKYTTEKIIEIYGFICYLCNEKIDLTAPRNHGKSNGWEKGLHLDHVIPLSKGGTDTIDNVKPTHAICNLRKHDKGKYEIQ